MRLFSFEGGGGGGGGGGWGWRLKTGGRLIQSQVISKFVGVIKYRSLYARGRLIQVVVSPTPSPSRSLSLSLSLSLSGVICRKSYFFQCSMLIICIPLNHNQLLQ